VQLLWSDASDADVRTTWFFRYSGGSPTSTDCNNLAADIYGVISSLAPLWGADTDLTGVEVTDLSSASGGQGIHSQVSGGTRTGGPLSGGTCLVIGFVITRRYRGGKPRSYLPWLTSTDLSSRQQWQGTTLTLVDSDLAGAFASIIGLNSGTTTITDHVNVSYYSGFTVYNPGGGRRARNIPTLRTVPVVDVITSFSARSSPGSQRRRNR
jgi:hypothetical protein